jgi:Ion channel
MHQIPILLPLVVGTGAILCTILIHAMPVGVTIWFVRRERKIGHAGRNFWGDTTIVVPVVLLVMVAHLIEIALWAIVFRLCGECADIGTAYYYSAVNFTTLGSGDVLLSPHWRMLGPLEAAAGMLMFGVSTAQVFTVIARLAQTRFADLKF